MPALKPQAILRLSAMTYLSMLIWNCYALIMYPHAVGLDGLRRQFKLLSQSGRRELSSYVALEEQHRIGY
jgi:hypothetical protein